MDITDVNEAAVSAAREFWRAYEGPVEFVENREHPGGKIFTVTFQDTRQSATSGNQRIFGLDVAPADFHDRESIRQDLKERIAQQLAL